MDNGGKLLLVLAVAAAALVAVVVLTLPSSEPDGSNDPASDPVDPVIPESPYPEGITFDPSTGVLSSTEEIQWSVVSLFDRYVDRVPEEYVGSVHKFDPGYYRVTAKGESFEIIAEGTISKTDSWKYSYGGVSRAVSVTYGINVSELAGVMAENGEWNKSEKHYFKDLPREVYVNDSVRSIVSQMEVQFKDMGGSVEDRQSFADFLASYAQCSVKYPDWSPVFDEGGNPVMDYTFDGKAVQRTSTDYDVWGRSEYWANTLETLFFGIGDCEDSAAVACALFKAAGFKTAMVGSPGHVMASVALDSFTERDLNDYKDILKVTPSSYGLSCSDDAIFCDDRSVSYYGAETTEGQSPVGYLLKGPDSTLKEEDKNETSAGRSGFYSVQ